MRAVVEKAPLPSHTWHVAGIINISLYWFQNVSWKQVTAKSKATFSHCFYIFPIQRHPSLHDTGPQEAGAALTGGITGVTVCTFRFLWHWPEAGSKAPVPGGWGVSNAGEITAADVEQDAAWKHPTLRNDANICSPFKKQVCFCFDQMSATNTIM